MVSGSAVSGPAALAASGSLAGSSTTPPSISWRSWRCSAKRVPTIRFRRRRTHLLSHSRRRWPLSPYRRAGRSALICRGLGPSGARDRARRQGFLDARRLVLGLGLEQRPGDAAAVAHQMDDPQVDLRDRGERQAAGRDLRGIDDHALAADRADRREQSGGELAVAGEVVPRGASQGAAAPTALLPDLDRPVALDRARRRLAPSPRYSGC